MDENNSRRRTILRSITGAGVLSGIGVSGLSSSVSARTITPEDTGEISDGEWDNFEKYSNNRYSGSAPSTAGPSPDRIATGDVAFRLPNPVKLGFDVCAQLQNGNQLCLSNFAVGERSYVDCAGKKLTQYGLGIESLALQPNGTFELSWSAKAWLGFDSSGCVWVGTGAAWENSCTKVGCDELPNVSVALDDVKDKAWNFGEDIATEIYYSLNQPAAIAPGTQGATALIAICAVVAFLIVIPPTGL
jgi:hypothetical protein